VGGAFLGEFHCQGAPVSTSNNQSNSFPKTQSSQPVSGDNTGFRQNQPEHFVDPNALAEHLSVTRRQVLEMTRRGIIPGHPLGIGTGRRVWRYKISEVETALASGVRKAELSHKADRLADDSARRTMPDGSPHSQRRNSNG